MSTEASTYVGSSAPIRTRWTIPGGDSAPQSTITSSTCSSSSSAQTIFLHTISNPTRRSSVPTVASSLVKTNPHLNSGTSSESFDFSSQGFSESGGVQRTWTPLPTVNLIPTGQTSSSTPSSSSSETSTSNDAISYPSRLSRCRSSSEPFNSIDETPKDTTDTSVTSSSSSSLSNVRGHVVQHFTYFPAEPKEHKYEKNSPIKKGDLLASFTYMQVAEQLIKTGRPNDLKEALEYLWKAIKIENKSKTPWVEPYFQLVDLLLDSKSLDKNRIIPVLDRVIYGKPPFSLMEKVGALVRKAKFIAASRGPDFVKNAVSCLEVAKSLVYQLKGAEERVTKDFYLAQLDVIIISIKTG
jgi:hypothetical protein